MSLTRTYVDKQYALIKYEIRLYASVSVGAAGAVTLQKWNYPVFGTGPNARTYTAATTGTAPTTAGNYPNRYTAGAEGVFSVTRTGAGLWTILLQDNYQRMVGMTGFVAVAGGLANIVTIAENTTISNMTSPGGSVIGLAMLSATGVAADPTAGSSVRLCFTLANGTEP